MLKLKDRFAVEESISMIIFPVSFFTERIKKIYRTLKRQQINKEARIHPPIREQVDRYIG